MLKPSLRLWIDENHMTLNVIPIERVLNNKSGLQKKRPEADFGSVILTRDRLEEVPLKPKKYHR